MKALNFTFIFCFVFLQNCSNPTLTAVESKINKEGADLSGADLAGTKSIVDNSFSMDAKDLIRPVQISLWSPPIGFGPQNEQTEASKLLLKKQKMRIWLFALAVAQKISLQRDTSIVVLGADDASCKEIFVSSETNLTSPKFKFDSESCPKTKDLSPLAFSRAILGACRGEASNPVVTSVMCQMNVNALATGNPNPFEMLAINQLSILNSYDAPAETFSVQIFPPSGIDSRLYPRDSLPRAASLHKSGVADRSFIIEMTNQKECTGETLKNDLNLVSLLKVETKGTSLPFACENWDAQQSDIISKIVSGSRKKLTLPASLQSKSVVNIKAGDTIVSPSSYKIESGTVNFFQDPASTKDSQKITVYFKN